jgi:hypothetical protein
VYVDKDSICATCFNIKKLFHFAPQGMFMKFDSENKHRLLLLGIINRLVFIMETKCEVETGCIVAFSCTLPVMSIILQS